MIAGAKPPAICCPRSHQRAQPATLRWLTPGFSWSYGTDGNSAGGDDHRREL